MKIAGKTEGAVPVTGREADRKQCSCTRGDAMGIGGKINRPRTELRKKLFKRRRELARGRRQKRRSAPAVQAPLWGKRRRKELKRLRGAAKSALEAAVAGEKRPEETRTGTGTGDSSGDVEMAEVAPGPE